MRLTTALTLAALLATITVTPRAEAELLVYEGFDYAAGSLADQGGGIGFAPESTWPGGEVVEGSLSYTDGMSTSLPTTGNRALISAESSSQSLYRALNRNYGTDENFGPGTYWVSFLGQRLQPHATDGENAIRSHGFQLHNGEGDERVAGGKATTPSPASMNWSLFSDGDGSLSSETSASIFDPTFLVIQVDIADTTDGNNSDTASMWVNPSLDGTLGAPDAELTQAAGNNFDYLFNTVRLWAGGSNDAGPYAEWTLDEIRIGTFLEDVTGGVIVPGDTNGDGVVTGEDLTPIRTNYRQTVSLRRDGDLNGDGVVTLADFREFKTGLLAAGGSLEGLDLAFVSVPEPTSALLIGAALAGAGARSRRRR